MTSLPNRALKLFQPSPGPVRTRGQYYTSHSKRVRRKRNRHAQAVSTYVPPLSPLGTANPARPLRPEGWTVRYEYKMACFAEFRGEFEVALK